MKLIYLHTCISIYCFTLSAASSSQATQQATQAYTTAFAQLIAQDIHDTAQQATIRLEHLNPLEEKLRREAQKLLEKGSTIKETSTFADNMAEQEPDTLPRDKQVRDEIIQAVNRLAIQDDFQQDQTLHQHMIDPLLYPPDYLHTLERRMDQAIVRTYYSLNAQSAQTAYDKEVTNVLDIITQQASDTQARLAELTPYEKTALDLLFTHLVHTGSAQEMALDKDVLKQWHSTNGNAALTDEQVDKLVQLSKEKEFLQLLELKSVENLSVANLSPYARHLVESLMDTNVVENYHRFAAYTEEQDDADVSSTSSTGTSIDDEAPAVFPKTYTVVGGLAGSGLSLLTATGTAIPTYVFARDSMKKNLRSRLAARRLHHRKALIGADIRHERAAA
jgi:hypothetical protein